MGTFCKQLVLTHTHTTTKTMLLVDFTGLIFSLVLVKCVMRWMESRSDPVSTQQSDFKFCGSWNLLAVMMDEKMDHQTWDEHWEDTQLIKLNFIHSFEAGFIMSRTDCIVECVNPDVFLLPFIKISGFTKVVYALSGIIGHWGFFFTVIWCSGCHCALQGTVQPTVQEDTGLSPHCLPRETRRKIFHIASFYVSVVLMLQFSQLYVCRNRLTEVFIYEYMTICIVFALSSRTWNHLKTMAVVGDGKNFNIWTQLKMEEAPEIRIGIDCYHMERDNDHVTTYREIQLIPYSCWWIDTGAGDSNQVESGSKTYIGTCEDKLTFVDFKYSAKPVDDFTSNVIQKEIKRYYELNKKRDMCCNVSLLIMPFHGPNKMSLRPKSMPLPLICKTWFFWIFTVLPLPFFNGALIRLLVNSRCVEVRKNIVYNVEIRPDTVGTKINKNKPHMNPSKGYQLSNMIYSDMDLHQRLDLQRMPV